MSTADRRCRPRQTVDHSAGYQWSFPLVSDPWFCYVLAEGFPGYRSGLGGLDVIWVPISPVQRADRSIGKLLRSAANVVPGLEPTLCRL